MQITNVNGLPQAFYEFVKAIFKYPPRPKRLSVTDLIGPPQIRVLKMKHWDGIVQDVSEFVWMALGMGLHALLEKHADPESLAEEKMSVDIDGWTIIGKPDVWKDEVIQDYKVTSVWSVILGEKPEWERQLNVYRWLFHRQGFETKKIEIVAFFRDWKRTEASRRPDYPQTSSTIISIPLWPLEKAEAYVMDRLRVHRVTEEGGTLECTEEERWRRPDTWAVKKPGNIRALRVFATETEARTYLNGQKLVIEARIGQDTRCASFCPVRDFCPQWAKNKPKEEVQEEISL